MQRGTNWNLGIGKAGDILSELVEREVGRPLSADERTRILRAFASRSALPPIYADGQPVAFNGKIESAIRRVGEEVAAFVSQTWRTSDRTGIASDASQVLLVGGGAYYIASLLRPRIPHLIVPPVPEIANVEGYLRFGMRMKERWDAIT